MWIVATVVAFAAAIAAHAVLSHLPRPPLNMVSRFVAPGAPIGIVLGVFLLGARALPIEVIAGLLGYALLCEIYIFVYTMISSSVSVSLLLKLRSGSAAWAALDAQYSDEAMVDGRLAKLETNGLITSTSVGYAVTPRGEALVLSFARIRRFFRHPGDATPPPPRRAPRVEAQQTAGQDVG